MFSYDRRAKDRIPTLTVEMHRTETLVKGYNGSVELHFIPRPAYAKLSDEAKQDALEELSRLKTTDLRVGRTTGDVSIREPYLGRLFSVDVDDRGDWEYDDGEVTTLETEYDDLRVL